MIQVLDKNQHKIWITRPELDAHNQVEILHDLGIQSVQYPLLQVVFSNAPLTFDTHTCQAIIFTSANGVRAYVQKQTKKNFNKNIPVFAVGDITCEIARASGFTNIHTARGDVLSLADVIKQRLSPQDGYIYHPASTIVARDLGILLSDFGYKVHREVAYTVHPCTHIANDIQHHIQHRNIGGVILMSPRTASIFTHMIEKHALNVQHMHIFALSKAIADKVYPLKTAGIHTAHYPNFVQVLRHIKREYNIHDEYR